ncbi:MAG: multiheme c-type cytochrome [Desulfatiglandaceae bacterium]
MAIISHFPKYRLLGISVFILLASLSPANATDQYARDTGKGCIFCHQESTGGPLKTTGFAYIRNGYDYPISERVLSKAEALQDPFHKTLRFVIGYLHLLAAVVFFGAIFYIHIFVKPKALTGGLPKSERILGVSCMATLTLTGAYLTWVRMDKWEQFHNNTFGLMLSVKILLFALMVAIGILAITAIHRGMKSEAQDSPADSKDITRSTLPHFNGSEGGPAYVVYNQKIYDVSNSPKWKAGRHFGRHNAGADLTQDLEGAPHGAEVFEEIPSLGEIARDQAAEARLGRRQRIFLIMAYTNLVIIFLILGCISVWRWGFPIRILPETRKNVLAGADCVSCHGSGTPGIYHDWKQSMHAKVGVDCLGCHKGDEKGRYINRAHLKYDQTPVKVIVTPRTCGTCHPKEAQQYQKSKHANTHQIIWAVDHWLNDGMNNAIERTTGCYACHGTVVDIKDGRPVPGTWPNVGVGRINPDGTKGSCSSCHTRHSFSIIEARKPEACDQCHLGPDHPQIEIYNESKHGTIYHAEGDRWNWDPDDQSWDAGADFRAPTCATCHMSAAPGVSVTHDVTERLSWETQAPLTVRPADFKPFPAQTDWREARKKMETICQQCHSKTWTSDHFQNLDRVIQNYNDLYYGPAKAAMDDLYGLNLLSRETYFDEPMEWEFYELWHHEGRRARMGAAMMAPDYAWWHGFYELKHRFNKIMERYEGIKEKGGDKVYDHFPGKHAP